jgi:heptosyltransferase-1
VRPLLEPASIRSILAVKLSSLGDIVHVTPCLRALRKRFPQARIVMAVDRPFAGVVRCNPHLDGLLEADPEARGAAGKILQTRRALTQLPDRRFDLAIDFQGRPRSALWVYLSRAGIQAGNGNWRPGWQLTMQPDLGRHAVRRCATVLQELGVPVDDLEPEVVVSPLADARAGQRLAEVAVEPAGFVLFNPFSRWPSKEWPLACWIELVQRIRGELGLQPVIVGGPEEMQRAERLMAELPPGSAVSLVGRLRLDEALAVYRRARLMVTGDSGPMHLAAALGTPVVALFGPTWPESTGPWGDGHRVIQAHRPASPHAYRTDPQGEYIGAIAVETVFQVVVGKLLETASLRRAA